MNPEDCKNIEEIRQAIDEIDYQILKLFSQRCEFVKEIVKFKTDAVSVIAENRQKEVIAKRREWATELAMNPDLFENIYWMLMHHNIQEELKMLENSGPNQI